MNAPENTKKIKEINQIDTDESNREGGSDVSEHYNIRHTRSSMSVDQILDEMPPEICDLKKIMKKKRNTRTDLENNAIKDFVATAKFFRQAIHTGQVSIDAMDDICTNLQMRVYDKNSIVFRQGDLGKAFYIVLEGLVHVLINPEGGFSKSEDEKFAEKVVEVFENEAITENNATTVKDGDGKNKAQAEPMAKVKNNGAKPNLKSGITSANSNIKDVSQKHDTNFQSRRRDWMRRKSQVIIEEEVKSLYGAVKVATIQDGGCFGDLGK
jgi:hypothetical protein